MGRIIKVGFGLSALMGALLLPVGLRKPWRRRRTAQRRRTST